jgi:hypothetical protein
VDKFSSIRKKQNYEKDQVKKIILIEGEKWRRIKRKEKILKQQFLKCWQEYLHGKNQSAFLMLSVKYGYLIEQENIEHAKLKEKYAKHVKRFYYLDSLLHKQ